jgi:N-acetylglucosamine transport system substrate-binding protein
MTTSLKRIVAGAACVALFATTLTACAGGGGSTETSAPPADSGGEVSADNPFGLAADATIDAVIFNGGYATDYVDYAGEVLKQKFPGVTVNVTASTEISAEMQPRFVGGNPPDLLDNQGAQSIPLSTIIDQLSPLDELWQATNYDGVKIEDAVMAGVKDTGTYNGNFVYVPYVVTLWAFYYSASLFEENGWTPPRTWDDALALCDEAKAKDLYLFVWGKEAASYWKIMAFDSIYKQSGPEPIENIANLVEGAWSDPAVVAVLEKFKEVIDKGCFIPGGAGTQFTQAQAQWSNDQQALLYYTGSWIENEMKSATADNFQMTAWPTIVIDEATAALPFEAVDAGADEKFVIPAQGANKAGGFELMRAMLSNEAAANFAKTRLAPTIVLGTVPADGFGSTALATTSALIEESGSNTFAWSFGDYASYYSMGPDELVIWNAFLSGEKSIDSLIADEEALNAKAKADTTIDPVTYDY